MALQIDREALASQVNEDQLFGYLARYWDAVVRIEQGGDGDQGVDIRIVDGTVVSVDESEGTDWNVRIAGTSEAWDQALAPVPAPGAGILAGIPGMVIEGDVVADTGPYGAAIHQLVRVLSELERGPAPTDWVGEYPFKATDTAVGRYAYYSVEGVEYRVYYEQAGEGTPLLLQHTAGGDSRQWRHLLADPVMQAEYAMTAFDLPYHGRSLPPTEGVRWWEQDYAVSKEDLHQRIVGLSRALGLDRPIFMGTSMGGHLAPEMIGHYPDDFRGAVAVNGWYHMDALAGFTNEYFHHPRIPTDYIGSVMYSATSPLAPEPFRRENSWIYASGGPAVFKGDNDYFTFGHDLRTDGHLVDTDRTPLAVVVGEYDPAAWMPGGSEEIAKAIPGSTYHVFDGLSHFAMADDPVRFNAAIKPVLDRIVEDARRISQRG
jgi:pimeloyl-ACP methyl ester carboxylesterase